MKQALYIIPECYADTNLVSYLMNAAVNHQKGCNQVANTMNKGKNADGFSIGIIDNDKVKHSYVNEFVTIATSIHLDLMKHNERAHYIILVKKAIEDFILSAANEVQFDFSSMGFDNSLEDLKVATKDCQANVSPLLIEIFRNISNAREMKILKNCLNYLNQKKYEAKQESIIQIFSIPDIDIQDLE